MNVWFVLSIPLITAFIGWLTNKVAVKMLFRPRRPLKILGWRWQGLIPRRQAEIATRTGEIVEREILGQHLLRDNIRGIDLRPHLSDLISRLIEQGVGEQLKQIPLVGSFVNDSTLATLKTKAVDEMNKAAPGFVEKLADEAESRLNIKSYIEEQVSGFDLDKLESVVTQIASNEFRTIELMGGVLGFLVGTIQLLILWATGSLA